MNRPHDLPDDLVGGYLAVHAAADAARRDVRRWAVRDLIRGPGAPARPAAAVEPAPDPSFSYSLTHPI